MPHPSLDISLLPLAFGVSHPQERNCSTDFPIVKKLKNLVPTLSSGLLARSKTRGRCPDRRKAAAGRSSPAGARSQRCVDGLHQAGIHCRTSLRRWYRPHLAGCPWPWQHPRWLLVAGQRRLASGCLAAGRQQLVAWTDGRPGR